MKVSTTRSRFNKRTCWTVLAALVALTALLGGFARAGDMGIHSSGRYYQDASGKPLFLIGCYDWQAMSDETSSGIGYVSQITNGGPYKINYIRITCGANNSGHPDYTGHTPVPWVDVGGGVKKAQLANMTDTSNPSHQEQWDPVFWNSLHNICHIARDNGVFVNICLFDGVNLRDYGWAGYGYRYSDWNPDNQDKVYYTGNSGDCGGCFYRVADFNANTGIGHYQRAFIQKVIDTTAEFDNVMFEIGNELGGADSAWNTAVISYVKSKCNKPIDQCGGEPASNLMGLSDHWFQCVAGVKPLVANIVGHGYPAWADPDNNEWPACFGLMNCAPDCTAAYAAVDNGQRQGAWLSFTGGAACWGGFTEDYWEWPQPHRGFSTTLGTYYRNLQNFISNEGVQFWTMTPQHSLVSNSSTNSCLARTGMEYVAYILSDATATLDLSAVSGNAYYKLYNPVTGTYSAQQVVAGGAVRSFNRPGASDWVIHVYTTIPTVSQTVNVKPAGTITIDGSSADWNLSDFTTPVPAGQSGTGDYALTGYYNGNLYYGSYAGVLPTDAADHTAKVYVRHDLNYLYLLARCDDNDIRFSTGVDANWQNDCMEVYVDPGHEGGANPISNSTSDIQLVIDANNRKNVYMTNSPGNPPASGYGKQVLDGVTSEVVRDGTGWWLEARILKSALDPDMPAGGTFGLDFNFRDNDNDNDGALTTVYTWCDNSFQGFPSKIPDRWGNAFVTSPNQTPYPGPGAAAVPGVIEAENFDNGGEGVAYHDFEPANNGGQYRPAEGVDIMATTDTGGGYNVGWTGAGEWMAYTINVTQTRNYDIKARVASPVSGGSYHIEINGQAVTGSQAVPNTGGAQTWATVTTSAVHLTAGQQILKMVVDVAGWDINYLDIQPTPTAPAQWNTMGTPTTIGSGQMPAVATDSAGNIHVVYLSGSGVQYKKFDSSVQQITSEFIASPTGGAYWPSIAVDSNDAPHIIFSEYVDPALPYALYCYYTNRIGGNWKTPTRVIDLTLASANIWRLKLALWGGYAYAGCEYSSGGRIDRITNLTGTPTVDRTATTPIRSTIAVTPDGQVWAVGRNGPNQETSVMKFSSELVQQMGVTDISEGSGKPGAPAAAWADKNNVAHFIAWGILAGGSGVCDGRCGMVYNSTARWNPIFGLLGGPGGTGPDGNEGGGWWNEDVSPAIAVDSAGKVYIAWRNWSTAGEGVVSRITNVGAFAEVCTPVTACGGNKCTGYAFSSTISRRRWYNCDLAPATTDGGVYVVWETGGTCYLRGVGIDSAIEDHTPPGPVTDFTATGANRRVNLSWTNPTDADFNGTMIRYSATVMPQSITDGTLLVDKANTPGSTDSYSHTGVTPEVTYFYKAFAHDESGNYDTTADGDDTTPYDKQVVPVYTSTFDADAQGWNLSTWNQFPGTYPVMAWVANAGCLGGGIQCIGAGVTDSCTQGGLREGGEMWKVFSTVSNGVLEDIRDLVVYFDVKTNIVGSDCTGYTGSADHGLMEEQLTAYCSADGGTTWWDAGYLRRADLNGLQTCGTRYIDLGAYPACNNNPNFAVKLRWQLNTGPESGAGADIGNVDNVVIMGTGTPPDIWAPGPVTNFTAEQTDNGEITLNWTDPTDDDLTGIRILYKTTGYPSAWNDGTATVAYDSLGTSYVHTGLTGGTTYYYSAFTYDEVPNYSIRTDVSKTLVTILAPGPITSFKTYGGNQRIDLAWTNPTNPNPIGIKILCKAGTGFPLSPTDPSATVVYDALGASCSNTGLNNGTKYYYAAYAYTTPTTYSTVAQSSTYAAAEVTIPTMKGLANSVIRSVKGNVVTAVFTGYFYMQDPLNPYGIKVSTTETPLPSIGQKIDVLGSMTGIAGNERSLSCTGNWIRVTDPGPITIVPAALNNKAIGGANLNSYTPGVVGGIGANNVGLLVRVCGKVTQSASGYFYVDDGCGLKDGTKTSTIDNVGVRIKVTAPSGVVAGKYVVVTGIISPLSAGGLRPQILPLSQPAGVQLVGP